MNADRLLCNVDGPLGPDQAITGRIGLEPMTGFEPVTCCLRNSCSTTELHRRPTDIMAGLDQKTRPSTHPGRLAAPGVTFTHV